jgi:uncharacterized protein YdaU (DUF1376 family)
MTQETRKKAAITSFVIPFTQFDWGDYFTDTDYLDFEEHGVYWNLLKRYYTTGPFDNNFKVLQRITRCPRQKLEAMKNILEEFFFLSEDDDCWHHKRCDEEIRKVKKISEVQSRKARKGISERKRNPDNGQFISLPAGAGQSPAIKEVISKNEEIEERYKDVINEEERLRLINKGNPPRKRLHL